MMSEVARAPQDSIRLVTSQHLLDNRTDMETCGLAYEWTIKNWNRYHQEIIESPSFSSHYSDFNDEWILRIDSNYRTSLTYMSVQLQLQSFNNTSKFQTECIFSIHKKNEEIHKKIFTKSRGKTEWNVNIFGFGPWEPFYGYVQNDEIKVCCTITMYRIKINNSDVISRLNATQKLSADLKELLLNEQLSDVTIQVGRKSFPVIRGILAVRSPVFAAMFSHEQLKENEKNKVVIEDIDEDVFEEFLHFIYTGESPNVAKMPMDLLAVAEKYQVDCLKNVCEKVIGKRINFDNVASILVCSDSYNLEILNDKCLEFMKNNLQSVLLNKTFEVEKKKHPEFFLSVLEKLLLS